MKKTFGFDDRPDADVAEAVEDLLVDQQVRGKDQFRLARLIRIGPIRGCLRCHDQHLSKFCFCCAKQVQIGGHLP